MAGPNKGRTIAIAIIAVNAVVTILLAMAVMYLFFQVTSLRDENKNLRNKWQIQQAPQTNSHLKKVNDIAKVNVLFSTRGYLKRPPSIQLPVMVNCQIYL